MQDNGELIFLLIYLHVGNYFYCKKILYFIVGLALQESRFNLQDCRFLQPLALSLYLYFFYLPHDITSNLKLS